MPFLIGVLIITIIRMRKPRGGLIKRMYLWNHKVEFYYHSKVGYQIDVYIDWEKEDEIETEDSYDLDYKIIDWYYQWMEKIMDKYN